MYFLNAQNLTSASNNAFFHHHKVTTHATDGEQKTDDTTSNTNSLRETGARIGDEANRQNEIYPKESMGNKSNY